MARVRPLDPGQEVACPLCGCPVAAPRLSAEEWATKRQMTMPFRRVHALPEERGALDGPTSVTCRDQAMKTHTLDFVATRVIGEPQGRPLWTWVLATARQEEC